MPVFRNVRYAQAARFERAEILPFVDADSAEGRGPIAPQLPSRLAIALGPQEPLRQAEECQVLSIFTPSRSGSRPVLLWFHGGAHVSGGGELPWYDGVRLASEQDLVVVAVTFRLGVLGNYYDPGLIGPSPATTDQMVSIEWVHRNIAAFGGDPNQITLAGQSAGAFSIEVMLRWGLGKHVVGVILQSGNLRDPTINYTRRTAIDHSSAFDALLRGRNPRDLSAEQLLRHQRQFVEMNGVTWAPARPDLELPLALPILGGWTADDDLPFTMLSHGLENLQWRDRKNLEAQVQSDTKSLYADPTMQALDETTGNGAPAWAYRFTWGVPGSPWGSPHCIELPFLLGDDEAWQAAPILAGSSPQSREMVGRRMRRAWGLFTRVSAPGGNWTRWSPERRVVNDLPQCLGD